MIQTDVKNAVLKMDKVSLYELNRLVVQKIRDLTHQEIIKLVGTFNVGDEVWWVGRHGRGRMEGTIEKVNLKTCVVMCPRPFAQRWKVSTQLLHKKDES